MSEFSKLIDGKRIAAEIREELKQEVSGMVAQGGAQPGLAVVLVGSRQDSSTYVRMKAKACTEAGIHSVTMNYPESITEEELLEEVRKLDNDPAIHGILVQLPLPTHINELNILTTVSPSKDVDGLHPQNVACLSMTQTHAGGASGRSAWSFKDADYNIPCTPMGCIELLERSGVVIEGMEAVVVGRSNMVGVPVAHLLMHKNATVTIAHSRTKNLEEVVRRADIVVAAVGRAEMIKGAWIKPGAVVIDVGINSVEDSSKKSGYRLVGDVEFDAAKEVASLITPVPGGVGPMTIAMLLRNTVNTAKRKTGFVPIAGAATGVEIK